MHRKQNWHRSAWLDAVGKGAFAIAAVAAWCWAVAPAFAGTVEFVMQEDADAEEQATVREAASIANMIVNSDCFRDFMAARKLVETNGRSPVDVARQLQDLSGRISVAFYYRCMKLADDCPEPTLAVAYRQPPDHAINLNRAYYDVRGGRFDIHELAGTLAHEAIGHVLGGYDHSFDWTPERDFSVPYSISGASIANGDAFLACRGETTGRE